MNKNHNKLLWGGVVALISLVALILIYKGKNRSAAHGRTGQTHFDAKSVGEQKLVAAEKLGADMYRISKERNGRIEFFGRIVDQVGAPIPDAEIVYRIITGQGRLPGGGMSNKQDLTITSHKDGSFHIEGYVGTDMDIVNIIKAGYRPVGGTNPYGFSFGSNAAPHKPDANRPVKFLMVPVNQKRVKSSFLALKKFRWNGEPYELPIDNTGESFLIRATRDKKDSEADKFEWKVEIELKGGSIMKMDPAFKDPVAPEEGYQRSVEYGESRIQSKWGGGTGGETVVFKTVKGLYGKAVISINASNPDGKSGGTMKVNLNEEGARNLD